MFTLSLVLSMAAVIGVIGIIISQVMIARNLAGHVRKLKETIKSLKEALEQQISTVEGKIKTHSDGQAEWEISFRKFVQDQLTAQASKYELHVKGIHEALDRISDSRESIAGEIGRFVRVLVAALKGERALFEELTKIASPKAIAQPSTETQPVIPDKDGSKPQE